MMQEEELVVERDDADEVSIRSFTDRRVPEFSTTDGDIDNNYVFTHFEVFAAIVIMLSTISGGFLEGYSSPVISSLLDPKVFTLAESPMNVTSLDIQTNSTIVDNTTELDIGNGILSLNSSDSYNISIPLEDDSIQNYTDILTANATSADIFPDAKNGSASTNESTSEAGHVISMHFSIEQASWFGSLLLLGAFIGAVISSVVVQFGRRHAILLSSLPRFAGWMLIILSPSIATINFGRFLTGISVGMVTSAGPIYISEVTHPSKRGAFSCFIQLGVNVGIFLAALLGASLAWKALALCGVISVFMYAIPTFKIPNSPYWLVLQDRDDEAQRVLKKMRPQDYHIEAEFTQIKAVAQNMKRNSSIPWLELVQERRCALPLMLVLIVTAVNRFSGYNAVISYCSTFLHDAVPAVSPTWTAVAVCFIQVLATITSIALVDVWGRRKILISSISVMAISLITIAFSDTFFTAGMSFVAVLATMSYVAAYSFGVGPLTWVILGEMLPLDARDKASAIVASLNWLAAFLVTKTFFSWEEIVGISGVCITYALVCVVGCVLVYLLVPETKGRTLSEIEAHFNYSQGTLFTRNKLDLAITSIVDQEFATIDSYSTFT